MAKITIPQQCFKVLCSFLKPIEESLVLARQLNKKIDTQNTSKVIGQLRALESILESGDADKAVLQVALTSFYESAEYYKRMFYIADAEFNKLEKSEVRRYFVSGLTFNFFESNPEKQEILKASECLTYAGLYLIAEIGALLCQKALKYKKHALDMQYNRLSEFMEPVIGLFLHDTYVTLLRSILSRGPDFYKPIAGELVAGYLEKLDIAIEPWNIEKWMHKKKYQTIFLTSLSTPLIVMSLYIQAKNYQEFIKQFEALGQSEIIPA